MIKFLLKMSFEVLILILGWGPIFENINAKNVSSKKRNNVEKLPGAPQGEVMVKEPRGVLGWLG